MDKFYVIKNKKGLYYAEGAWTNIVDVARKYNTREDAEERVNSIITAPLSNCEVVEIPTIADLEAKLAESERLLEKHCYKNIQELEDVFNYNLNQVAILSQKLAEKEQAIESLQEINQSLGQTCNNDAKEIDRLNKLLKEEKNRSKKLNHEAQKYYEDAYCNGFQNQTAIAELEKLKRELEFTSNNNEWITARDDRILNGVCEYIDQQIKSLKGEK